MVRDDLLSILLPSFNESKNLNILIPEINKFLVNNQLINQSEIIVINDGSTDETEEIILSFKKNMPKLKLINLIENFGKPVSLDQGIKNSNGEIIAVIDSDLQYDPSDIGKMIIKIKEGYDIVNGNRNKRYDKFFLRLFSKIHNFILRIFFRANVYDFFSGLKVYKKKIYFEINNGYLPRYLIFNIIKYKYNLTEINIIHKNRYLGKSSYNILKRTKLALVDLYICIFNIFLLKKKINNKNNNKNIIRSII